MVYTSSDNECEVGGPAQLPQLPPRPPSCRSRDKAWLSAPASPELFSPTPSSGHFSGASLVSKSPETQV